MSNTKGVRFWFVRLIGPQGQVERNTINAAHLKQAASRAVASLSRAEISELGGDVGEELDVEYEGWAVNQNGDPVSSEKREIRVKLATYLVERSAVAA